MDEVMEEVKSWKRWSDGLGTDRGFAFSARFRRGRITCIIQFSEFFLRSVLSLSLLYSYLIYYYICFRSTHFV